MGADSTLTLLKTLVATDSINPSLVPGASGEAAIAAEIAAELGAIGLEVLVLQPEGQPGLDVAALGGARHAHRLAGDPQPFEVAALDQRAEAVAMLRLLGRQENVGESRLASLLEPQAGGEFPAALAQVDVAVVRLDPVAGIGGVAGAEREPLRQRLGHLHAYRHRRRKR